MSSNHYEILPNEGLGKIRFGTRMEQFIKAFGKPDELENIDEDEQINTTILHYWDKGLSVFFVGLEDQLLAGIETEHPDALLFGEKIMNRTEKDIVELMKKNGQESYEAEIEENDKRLSYDLSMMDFFFRKGRLVYMNFGVFVDEQGRIEQVAR